MDPIKQIIPLHWRTANDGGIARRELDNRIAVGGFVMICKGCAVLGRNHHPRQITVFVVKIPSGVNQCLFGYAVICDNNITLGRPNNSAFLIRIIVLLFRKNVNASDYVSLIIIGKKNSALDVSNKRGEILSIF